MFKLIKKYFVHIYFVSFLLTGVLIYDDYGVPCDESVQNLSAIVNFIYVNEVFNYTIISKDKINALTEQSKKADKIVKLEEYVDRNYGVINEFILLIPTFVFKLYGNTHLLYLTRHIMTFIIFWVSTIYFYLILNYLFRHKGVALLGVITLVLSPRIFADSFYNSKDLMLLSFMIIAMYYIIIFLDKRNFKNAILAGFISGLAIDIRIVAVILPVSAMIIFWIRAIIERKEKNIFIFELLTFIGFTLLSIYIFMPYLWESPVSRFIESWNIMSKYPHTPNLLYFGEIINSSNTPWHYTLVWIGITTPIIYIIFIIIGIYKFIGSLLIKQKNYVLIYPYLLFFAVGIGSLIAVIIFNSTLYNGWRQLYYIYPSLLLFGISGAYFVFQSLKMTINKKIFASLILIYFGMIGWKIIELHPYQMIYFNEIANQYADGNFEKDYWGLSQREGLEWLLNKYPEENINIYTEPFAFSFVASRIFDNESKKRIIFHNDIKKASFIASNEIMFLYNSKNMFKYYGFNTEQLILNKIVDGKSILKIYKLERSHNIPMKNPDFELILDNKVIKELELAN